MKLTLLSIVLVFSLPSFAKWTMIKKIDANQSWLKSDEVIMRASLSPNENKAAFLVYSTPTGWNTIKGRVLIVDALSMKIEKEIMLPTFNGSFSKARFSDSRTDLMKCYREDPIPGGSSVYWVDPEISWHHNSGHLIVQNQLINVSTGTVTTLNPEADQCESYSRYIAKFQPAGNLILTSQAGKYPIDADVFIYDLNYKLISKKQIPKGFNYNFNWVDSNSYTANAANCTAFTVSGREFKIDCTKQIAITEGYIIEGNGGYTVTSGNNTHLIFQDDGYIQGGGFKNRYVCEISDAPAYLRMCSQFIEPKVAQEDGSYLIPRNVNLTSDGLVFATGYENIYFFNPSDMTVLYQEKISSDEGTELINQTIWVGSNKMFLVSQKSVRVFKNK